MTFRADRTRRGCRARGWVALLLSIALAFAMLGRGHVLQALGLAVACEHPGSVAAAPEAHASDDGDSAPPDDCPHDCARCPCGQIPAVLPPEPAADLALFELDEVPASPPRSRAGSIEPHRLERPPRA